MKSLFKYLLLTILLIQPLCAQTPAEVQTIRNKRLRTIHVHNLSVGIDAGGCDNYFIAPKVYYRLGSQRNLFNADAGFRYLFYNPVMVSDSDYVSSQYVAPFIAANINFARWDSGAAYLGAEFTYNISTTASYHSISSSLYQRDNNIGKHYTNLLGRVGVRIERWDISLFASYGLAPNFNQKYIFESTLFNYDSVRSQLYSRYNFGLSLSYIIPF